MFADMAGTEARPTAPKVLVGRPSPAAAKIRPLALPQEFCHLFPDALRHQGPGEAPLAVDVH